VSHDHTEAPKLPHTAPSTHVELDAEWLRDELDPYLPDWFLRFCDGWPDGTEPPRGLLNRDVGRFRAAIPSSGTFPRVK
jgi:hypothetical protein